MNRIPAEIILDPRINLKKSCPEIKISSHRRPRIFGESAPSSSACARKRSKSTTSSGRYRTTWCLLLPPKTTMSMPISLSTMCSASIIIKSYYRIHLGKYNNRFYKIRSLQDLQHLKYSYKSARILRQLFRAHFKE
jgi:hypothetical protein